MVIPWVRQTNILLVNMTHRRQALSDNGTLVLAKIDSLRVKIRCLAKALVGISRRLYTVANLAHKCNHLGYEHFHAYASLFRLHFCEGFLGTISWCS